MSTQSEQDKDGTGAGPWWVAAALVVLLVAAGLVWVLLKGGSHPTPRAATPTTPGPNTSTAPSSTASSSQATPSTATTAGWPDTGCNGTPGSADPPQVGMKDVTWTPFLTVALPISPTLGPKRIAAPLRQCYQHSPSGALLAAVNILWAASSDPADYRKVLTAQMTPGAGQDKMLSSFAGGDPGNLAAFRLDGCLPSVCNVELVVFGHGVYATQTIPVTWTKGDWYLNGARPLADAGLVQGIPAGFTAWGPTS